MWRCYELCVSLWIVDSITIHKKPFDFQCLNCFCFSVFACVAMLNTYQDFFQNFVLLDSVKEEIFI